MRIVGSMTTLPGRILTVGGSIKYILRQSSRLDVFYLNIPLQTIKNKLYNIPDNFMQQFEGYSTPVVLNRCALDYGPITKLAPTLELEQDPNTYILTFDDDIIPHRHLVRKMKEKILQYPDTCLGFSGVCLGSFPFCFQFVIDNKKDWYVDWIQGVHVVAYKRSFFTTMNELIMFGNATSIAKTLIFNDDHRISSYLAYKGIPRMSIGCNIQDYLFKYGEGQLDALSARHSDLMVEHYKIIKYFGKLGLYHLSYTYQRSLPFLIAIVLGVGIITFFKTQKLRIGIRMILAISTIIIIIAYIRDKLALKTFSRLLLLENPV